MNDAINNAMNDAMYVLTAMVLISSFLTPAIIWIIATGVLDKRIKRIRIVRILRHAMKAEHVGAHLSVSRWACVQDRDGDIREVQIVRQAGIGASAKWLSL